mmetsp:Transcript_18980/g.56552  ORF Transcript_18980/g.56552 Transcript_18980/m.56552 type:complete len:207 (+) Transcript_18980:1362-1982(+)
MPSAAAACGGASGSAVVLPSARSAAISSTIILRIICFSAPYVEKRCRRWMTEPPSGRSAAPCASRIHGCSSASLAEGRFLGSRSSSCFSRLTACGDSCCSSFAFQLMFCVSTARHTSVSVSFRTSSQNGNRPVSSWYVSMPTLQMSHFSSYACITSSGAMYAGVPLRDVSLGSSGQCRMDSPKSVALRGLSGSLDRNRKLSGLTSR